MARNQDFKFCEDMGYVDIHGRDVRVIICEKTGSILIPIDELKNMGFSIYRKSQYSKLLIDDSQFTTEFNLYMLECAQTYMLKHKIVFTETEILQNINKVKQMLIEGHTNEPIKETPSAFKFEPKKELPSPPQFLKNHTIEPGLGANISVTTLREPTTVTRQSLNLLNNTKSPASSVRAFEQNNTPEPGPFKRPSNENRNQRNSRLFEPSSNHDNENRQNNSYEYRSQRNTRSFDQSSVTSDNSDDNRRQSNFFDQKKQRHSDNFRQNGRIQNNFNQNQDKFKNQQKRDSDNQDDDMKKIASIELGKPEHKVLVTFLEKPNVLWVQDVDNADTLVDIDKQIKAEVNKQRVVSRCEFNNIYLGKDEGEWYRCKPIKFKPLTVFFIDYGNTAQVTERDLREVSKELASIPAQAVRVTFDNPDYKIDAFEIITIQIVRRFDKGTYKVDIVTEGKAKENIPPSPKPQPPPVEKKPTPTPPPTPTYFDRPKPLCSLQDGQRVMVINEIDGKLVLRTKECYDKLKQVEQLIESATIERLPDKAKKGQLVLCNHNGKLHRGQVVAVAGDSVEIKLLDYGDKISANIASLKNITESLSLEPVTYIISPSFNGGKELSPKVKKLIDDMVAEQKKATVVLEGGDFNLKLTDGLLSDKIESVDEVSGRIMIKELKCYKPALGQGVYMLYSFKDSDTFTLIAADELANRVEDIIISELEDDQPHSPIVGEICYGFCQDNWSRCVVIREMNGRFEVKFVDFGNLEFLKAEHLRKANEDIKKTPILGVQGRFVGLPPLKNIEQLLQEHVVDGDEFNLTVKKFDSQTNICEVEAPELYKKIKESQ